MGHVVKNNYILILEKKLKQRIFLAELKRVLKEH